VDPVLPRHTAQDTLGACWWARGLALAERRVEPAERRVAVAGRRSTGESVVEPAGSAEPGDPAAVRRLEHWREMHNGGGTDGFATRLGYDGLDPSGLLALLRERPDTLGRRVTRPGWVDVVERALAAAPVTPDSAVALTGPVAELFGHPLRPFVGLAGDRLARHAERLATESGGGIDVAAVRAGFAARLAGRLARVAARTLVLELNVARVAESLDGADPAERFESFLRQIGTRAGLARLFREYPVLARLLAEATRRAEAGHTRLLARYAADRPTIVADLLGGADPGRLVAVEADAGDSHGGESVAILRFADGRAVVYKPRPVVLHLRFAGLVGWLNAALPGLDLRSPRTLVRDGYGWQEFIPVVPCPDPAGVERFYHRLGALLALLYAVDAADVHCENLIASGDQPVLVDVETLFHPSPPQLSPVGVDPAAELLASSVYRTALLPHPIVGEDGAADLSGIGGEPGTVLPSLAIDWAEAATDQMRLVRRPAELRSANNRPALSTGDGTAAVDPADYQSALLAGFRAGYQAIAGSRDEFVALLGDCADDEIRVVVRATQMYMQLIDESTHPAVLRDALDRDRTFDSLWVAASHQQVPAALVPDEIADLWAGDVPLMRGRPAARDLWTATGRRLPDALPVAPLTAAVEKVAAMGEVDLRDQEWVITATMATLGRDTGHRGAPPVAGPVPATAPDAERILAAACGIGDHLVARAVRAGDRANWLGLEPIPGGHWALRPAGASLADGYLGVALFLAQLAHLTGVGRYAELARDALRPVSPMIDTLAAEPDLVRLIGCGAFRGISGIGYALARVDALLGDDFGERCLPATIALAATAARLDDAPSGLSTGLAGCLAAMAAVYAETGDPSARALAVACGDRLANGAGDPDVAGGFSGVPGVAGGPAGGFSDGPAGTGWALLRHAALGDDRWVPAARALLGRDAAGLDPATGGYGWCGGVAGALVATAADITTAAAGDPARHAGLSRHVDIVARRPLSRDFTLCHGEMGIAEALTVLAGRGYRPAARVGPVRAGLVLGALDRYGPLCGTPGGVPTPGLLTGLAGIGYGLLRLAFADRVPPVLLLAAGVPNTPQ
jgi:type 2 lantibiotic biosynthesis protein LanM